MDPVTGDVLALVGGRDFKASSFNRATQARRQAGSAFKPIIYAAALERGYSPGTILRDLDTPIETGDAPAWLPIGRSRAVRVHAAARAQGVEQPRRRAAAAAGRRQHRDLLRAPAGHRVGAADGAVARARDRRGDAARADLRVHGVRQPRHGRRRRGSSRGSRTPQGVTIYDSPERHTQAISPTTALPDVEHARRRRSPSGTGAGARAAGFKLPAAGKTGTTDDYADAWFVGYTPHLVTGVWFGLDRPAPIMRGGFAGVVAVPAWGRFMKAATAGDARRLVRDAGRRREGRDLPAERRARDRRVPAPGGGLQRQRTAAQLVPVDAMRGRGRGAAGADARGRRAAGLRRSVPSRRRVERAVPAAQPGAYADCDGVSSPDPDGRLTCPECPDVRRRARRRGGSSVTMAARTASTDIVLERVLGPDGVMRMVMRQRR